MNVKDTYIIQAVLTGKDENAIQALYDRSFKKIKDFVRKNSGRLEDAEDLFQDVVVTFYQHVKAGKFDERYDIDGFLFTAARNAWINKVKREERKVALPPNYEIVSGRALQQEMLEEEREKLIQGLFEKMGEKCRELLTLVVYFDYSMKEVAAKMDLSNENAAKTQHYKCKQKLIELVGKNLSFKNLLKDAY